MSTADLVPDAGPDAEEAPLDPALPIIDPHLHVWDIRPAPGLPQLPQRFLLDEALATIARSGHAVSHSVFVECHQMYRATGPAHEAPLGESEFANGIAAMSASGQYGPTRLCHRIVAGGDLRIGASLEAVLDAHQAIAGERFRGLRCHTAWSEGPLFGAPSDPAGRGVMADPGFVAGARVLARRGLSLDIWCLHTQLGEVMALADAVPDLVIVLDHLGTPESTGAWADRAGEAHAQWRAAIVELARRPNLRVKLGGIGMDLSGPVGAKMERAPSEALARAWAPLIEPAIAAFGAERAMFESNFPPDRAAGTYGATWNAFKRIAAGASAAEKDWLFRRTAAQTYAIAL